MLTAKDAEKESQDRYNEIHQTKLRLEKESVWFEEVKNEIFKRIQESISLGLYCVKLDVIDNYDRVKHGVKKYFSDIGYYINGNYLLWTYDTILDHYNELKFNHGVKPEYWNVDKLEYLEHILSKWDKDSI